MMIGPFFKIVWLWSFGLDRVDLLEIAAGWSRIFFGILLRIAKTLLDAFSGSGGGVTATPTARQNHYRNQSPEGSY